MPAALLTLQEAKTALNMTSTANDAEVIEYVEAATDLIEQRVGPIVQRTVTETLQGRDTFVLGQTPVISITSITGVLSGAVAYLPAGLYVDPLSGVMRRADRGTFGGDLFTVTYEAGRPGIAAPRFKQACRVLLQHLWRTQRGGGGSRPGMAEDGQPYGMGFSLPNSVVELLVMDLKATGIA